MAVQGRQYRHVNKRQRAITLEVQVCFFPSSKWSLLVPGLSDGSTDVGIIQELKDGCEIISANTKYIAPTLRYGKSCKIKHVYKAASKTDAFGPKSSNDQAFFLPF